MIRVTAVVALLMAPLASARAYSYAEHCRVSNRAFVLAVEHLKRRTGEDSLTTSQRHALDSLAGWARRVPCSDEVKAPSFAYGDLVARVDWAVTPADPFLAVVLARKIATDSLPVDAFASLTRVSLQDYRLLHENTEHFGARALLSYRTFHRVALDIASAGSGTSAAAFKALTLALYYNAFADHYLEDLHAPGHIFSPRGMLNDAQAGGTHNWYNKRGAYYYPARTSELAAYLVGPLPRDSAQPSLRAVIDSTCPRSMADTACASSLSTDTIIMFGDNRLNRSPAQELLVTLVIARSVSDVLETWLASGSAATSRRRIDDTGSWQWCGYEPDLTSESRIDWVSPNVITRYGEYRVEEGAGMPAAERWPTWRGSMESAFDGRDYASVAADFLWRSWPGEWLGGNDNFSTLDRSTNRGIEFRFPTRGIATEEMSGGAYLRFIWAFNRINTRLATTLGARAGSGFTQAHAGGAVEIGFGLLHLTLGPSVSYRPTMAADFPGKRWQGSMVAAISATYPPVHVFPVPRLWRPLPAVTTRERGQCGGQTYEVR